MTSFLITGASRGLGLAFIRELLSYPTSKVGKIFAGARGNAFALEEFVQTSSGRVSFVQLDVTDQSSIKTASQEVERQLGGKGLDVLINNAGVCYYYQDGIRTMSHLEESFAINVVGVHWVTAAFIPLLQKGSMKKVINMSTTLASTTLADKFTFVPSPDYKITKAAMNALTVQYAIEYEKEGFSFIALSPGWLKTELGGGDGADLTPEQGAKASLDNIFTEGQVYNGKFPKIFIEGWDNNKGPHAYDGTNTPW